MHRSRLRSPGLSVTAYPAGRSVERRPVQVRVGGISRGSK